MSKNGKNILICGVGGQGILLASEIISNALIKAKYDVKQSEVHGMSQRGGSVVAHLRFSDKVYSPLIELGGADIVVAFEMLESVRYLPYLHSKGAVIVNTQRIYQPSVATGIEGYPEDLLDHFRKRKVSVFPVDAFAIASGLGEILAVNMVLVGALSKLLDLKADMFLSAINERVSERFRDVNIEAFRKGRESIIKSE